MGIVENAAIGISSLLRYAQKQSNDISIVKDHVEDIKFLLLVQLLNNNIGNEEIPDHILETIFEKDKQVEELQKLCGDGYMSTGNFDYKTQLRFLRNALAHNHYMINDHLITEWHETLPYRATFDINWLRSLTNYVLGGAEFTLQKGMQDWIVIDGSDAPEEDNDAFLQAIYDKRIFLIRLESQTSSQESIKNLLEYKGKTEEISFSVMSDILKAEIIGAIGDLNRKDVNLIERSYNVVSDICSVLNYSVTAQFVVIDPNFNVLKMPNFDKLSKSKKIKLLKIMFEVMTKSKWNRQNLDCLFDILAKIEKGEPFDEYDEITLNLSRELLIKTYASILFNNMNVRDRFEFKSDVLAGFLDKTDMHYIHAKNVYKEIIKKLTNALNDCEKNKASYEMTRKVRDKLFEYTNKLNEVENMPIEKSLFRHIRNAVIHDYVFIDGDTEESENVKMFDVEPVMYIPKYNKKQGCFEMRPFERKVPLFELNMKYMDFLEFLSLTYELSGIQMNEEKPKR